MIYLKGTFLYSYLYWYEYNYLYFKAIRKFDTRSIEKNNPIVWSVNK